MIEADPQPRPQGAFPRFWRWGGVTVIWASLRFGHPHSHIPNLLGIPGGGCPKRWSLRLCLNYFRLGKVEIAQKKKRMGSKRWLKTWRNWNLQPHNIASLYNTSLFAKLQFYLIELFTSEQCRNRRQLRSSDSKQPKTRVLNKAIKRQTWIKLCWIHSMHDIWGPYNLTPQRYLKHERLSHNYRGLLHLRDGPSEITGGGVTVPPKKILQCKAKACLK